MGLYQSKIESSPAPATPPGMAAAVVYIAEDSPPYETPIDMRYPLHWNSKANFGEGGESGREIRPGMELAQAELRPLGILFAYGGAWGMDHDPDQWLSPCYFRVDFDEAKEETWKDIHETVVQTIKKHFGHLPEYQKAVTRYVRSDKRGDGWGLFD